jgi:hypothetical protein
MAPSSSLSSPISVKWLLGRCKDGSKLLDLNVDLEPLEI